MDMLPPKERMCHCAWFEKSCRELVASGACARWHDVTMTNPQTGAVESRWDCIDNHMFLLQLKQIQETRMGSAATESFRNEVARRYETQPELPMSEPMMVISHG